MSRRILRALTWVAILSVVLLWQRIDPFKSRVVHSELDSIVTTQDYGWGSILHRFNNHPTTTPPRNPLPWTLSPFIENSDPIRTWIVTFELAGLQTNGGIGSAYRELALTLASQPSFQVSILIARPSSSFTILQRTKLIDGLRSSNISVHFVEPSPRPLFPIGWSPHIAIGVYRFLRNIESQIDIIHFPENSGVGYFTNLAKFQGLAFESTKIVVGLHGSSTEWSDVLNKQYPTEQYTIQLGMFEKRSFEMADIIISPSEYMTEYVRTKGWISPSHSFVIPNIVDFSTATPISNKTLPFSNLNEIVFFGRLEERKGIRIFVEAIELLLQTESKYSIPTIDSITFLGRDSTDTVTNLAASSLITQALRKLQTQSRRDFTFRFIDSYDREAALAYLGNPHRLAVIPALADNSPSTVLECIAHSIRFIASNVGGIPELINVNDHNKVLFAPRAHALAEKISSVLAETVASPRIRQSSATKSAVNDWITLHKWIHSTIGDSRPRSSRKPLVTICITHFERPKLLAQLVNSIKRQTYTNYDVMLVDDGSQSVESLEYLDQLENALSRESRWKFRRIENSYLGEARNRGVVDAAGVFLLFLDDDDVLKPHALQTLVDVASRTNASALSTWLDEFATDVDPGITEVELPHRRTYWFVGQSISLGLLSNCFGSGNIFVKRAAFEAVGGFTTIRDVGGEDWEFYMRLAVAGHSQYVVPEELIYVRSDPMVSSMKWSMDPWDASFRSLQPLLNDPRINTLDISHSLMLAKATATKKYPEPPFAHSRTDFRLIQGWNGWSYSFPLIDNVANVESTSLAVVAGQQWSMAENRLTAPFIIDSMQAPFISSKGQKIAAVRSFRSPEALDVSLVFSYTALHQCGDGTRLRILLKHRPSDSEEQILTRNTMEIGRDNFQKDISLLVGSIIYIVVEPLETDDCDAVTFELKLIPVFRTSLAWSTINLQELEKLKQRSMAIAAIQAAAAPIQPSTQQWIATVPEYVDPKDWFHLALIFDANRIEHAKQVIRSAVHFIKSRSLHFHLLAPTSLHDQIRSALYPYSLTFTLYDHTLCYFHARQVIPFSDPSIHVSAHCKLFLSEILEGVDRVLYLDTDTTIASDITECYGEPGLSKTLISMSVDMGDGCQLDPDLCWPIGMHWRVTGGLKCGNLKSKITFRRDPPSCASEGELETVQVNGGVMLLELERMRAVNFVERYIQSIVHHYKVMGIVAIWGEQDFINSYFRLHPTELEFLPCGCNYQWFGSRREIKCANQPVRIAHAWSHGIATRSHEPYNVLFHHFHDNDEINEVPFVEPLSPSLPDASYSPLIIENNINCPTQSHDCSAPFQHSQYGQRLTILTRVGAGTFVSDLIRSIEEQNYLNIAHIISKPESMILALSDVPRVEIVSHSNFEADYKNLCATCSTLFADESQCDVPPSAPLARRAFLECLCSTKDSSSVEMYDLEAQAIDTNDAGWIMYLNDDRILSNANSVAHLMTHVNSEDQLIVFRSNSTHRDQEIDYHRKQIPASELSGLGFIFHSSHLDLTEWDRQRCGVSTTFDRLLSRLTLKWIENVPTISHPLHRFVPSIPPRDFKITVFLYETPDRPSWLSTIIEDLTSPIMKELIEEIIVVSDERASGTLGPNILIVNPSPGSGLSQLSGMAETDGALILSDSIRLDKASLTSLITFWLDNPLRTVGPFVSTSVNDFPPYLVDDEALFDYHSEADSLVGTSSYRHIIPRALLTHSDHLNTLSTILTANPIHSVCHYILLNAISTKISKLSPLRILTPPNSIVDRVHDCRMRSWPDVVLGYQAGDAEDEAGEPSFEECIKLVDRMTESTSKAEHSHVGVSGTAGMKVGIEDEVSAQRWVESRREEKCLKN